jgi:voltage-gated potassium channel
MGLQGRTRGLTARLPPTKLPSEFDKRKAKEASQTDPEQNHRSPSTDSSALLEKENAAYQPSEKTDEKCPPHELIIGIPHSSLEAPALDVRICEVRGFAGYCGSMIALVRAIRGLTRAVVAVGRDPETKALPLVAGALILTGTIFYWHFEDWTIIEALYFSVVTLTTVGYGDLHPTSPETQIFTIVYILLGIGVLVALVTSIAQQYIRQKGESPGARKRLSDLRQHGKGD